MLRLPLVILCVVLFAHGLFAGTALTVKEISLMLRSGWSSKAILADLATRHFAQTLDAEGENELIEFHASPDLIAALKSGEHAASAIEIAERQLAELQQAKEAKRVSQQAAANQPQRTEVVAAPAQTRSEFLTPSEIAAARRVEQAIEKEAAARLAASQPAQQRPAQPPVDPYGDDCQSKEWATKNRIRDAVEAARREARYNAESRANGGGQVIHSSSSYSSVTDDFETRNRIERSVEAARREEDNNARAKAYGGGEIHHSSESFDPGHW